MFDISKLINDVKILELKNPLAVNEFVEDKLVDLLLTRNDLDDSEIELKLEEIHELSLETSFEDALSRVVA